MEAGDLGACKPPSTVLCFDTLLWGWLTTFSFRTTPLVLQALLMAPEKSMKPLPGTGPFATYGASAQDSFPVRKVRLLQSGHIFIRPLRHIPNSIFSLSGMRISQQLVLLDSPAYFLLFLSPVLWHSVFYPIFLETVPNARQTFLFFKSSYLVLISKSSFFIRSSLFVRDSILFLSL